MSEIDRVEYRVMRRSTEAGDEFAIHEVFIDRDGGVSWTDPLSVACPTLEGLALELKRYAAALDLPVLDRSE